jgi:hypothetical protein
MMSRAVFRRGVLAAVALAFAPASARADEPPPPPSPSPPAAADEARNVARGLAEQGDVAFGAGRCDQAIPLWAEADRAYHAATIELRIAHCQALLGKVVEATATLEAMTKDKLPPTAPDAFQQAQAQATAELPTVRARVATLAVEEPRPLHISAISVDDVALDPKKGAYPIDPGRRLVRLRALSVDRQTAASWEGPITFSDGLRRTLATRTMLVPAPEPPHTLRNVGYVVGGAGVAAIGVGAFAGIAAITLGRPLERQCGPGRDQCPADQQDRISQVKTLSLVSDVFLASGVILLGAGGYLVVRDLLAEKPAPGLRLLVTGSSASLRGVF